METPTGGWSDEDPALRGMQTPGREDQSEVSVRQGAQTEVLYGEDHVVGHQL